MYGSRIERTIFNIIRHKKRGNAYRNGNNSNGRGREGIKKKNQMRNRYGSINVEKNTAKPPSPPIQDLGSNTSGKKPMLPYPPPNSWNPPPPPNTSWNPPPQGVWGELLEVEGEYSVSSKSYKQRGKGKSGKHRGGSESLDVNTNIGWQQYSPPSSWKKPSWSSINWNRAPAWIPPTTWGKPPQQYHPSNNSWKPANMPPPKMEPKPISWEPQQELEAGTTSRYTSPSGIKMCPCENKPKMPLPQPPSKMMPYSTKNAAMDDPSNPILSGGKANRSESHANVFANNKKDRKEFKKHIRESGGTRQEVKDYESNSDMRLLGNWGGPSLLCPVSVIICCFNLTVPRYAIYESNFNLLLAIIVQDTATNGNTDDLHANNYEWRRDKSASINIFSNLVTYDPCDNK